MGKMGSTVFGRGTLREEEGGGSTRSSSKSAGIISTGERKAGGGKRVDNHSRLVHRRARKTGFANRY